jgi:uncharacterized protein YndB with AHSA1/START domain
VIRFQTGVRIDRRRQDVFDLLADPATYPQWNSAVESVEPIAAPERPGLYRMRRRLPSGMAENRLELVTASAPDEVVVRASDGPTPFTYRYRLTPANGGTDLVLHAEVELEGVAALLGRLAGGAVKRGVDENCTR